MIWPTRILRCGKCSGSASTLGYPKPLLNTPRQQFVSLSCDDVEDHEIIFTARALTDLKGVLRRTRNAWEQLRGQRIFITGGTGFFGKWLVETFAYAVSELDLDATLVLLTRDPQRFLKAMPHLSGCESITFEQGDVRDFNFPTGEFSHVIHAATEAMLP